MRPLALLAAIALAAACAERAPTAIDRLHPCTSDEGPTDAYCGTVQVFENRETKQGRTIDLHIVLLPALSSDGQPDPLFFLAGGPGQGAAQMARMLRDPLRRIQADRDIVLVDQRGTGKSNPLNCESDTNSLKTLNESEEAALARLRQCLEGFDADVRLYTTPIAMDDLDDVRAHLGYERINLYGGSYGTRAALVYLRRHEARVRTVTLDGVAPPDMRLPLYFARDAQRALDKLLTDCAGDRLCAAKYPDLAARTRALLARLDAAPARVMLTHPRTGMSEEIAVDARFVTSVLFNALYMPLAASLIPELIGRAERNEFQAMLALMTLGEGMAENMSLGMHFSVVCAEDYPRIRAAEIEQHTAGTVFARHLIDSRMKVCEMWPRAPLPADYYEPVRSDVPVLILSGDLDPVTPPSWGESVRESLPNARHLVVAGTGHGALGTACGARLLRAFLDSGAADGLDVTCTNALHRPPFFVTPAGPDPGAGRPVEQP